MISPATRRRLDFKEKDKAVASPRRHRSSSDCTTATAIINGVSKHSRSQSSTGTPGSLLQSDSFSAADTAIVFTDAAVLDGDLSATTDNNTDVAQWWNTVPTDVDWTDVSSWMGVEGAAGCSSNSWATAEGNGSLNEM